MGQAEFQEKMAARSATFDADGDGTLTSSDLEEVARAVIVGLGLKPNSRKSSALLGGARRLWSGLESLA